MTFVEIGTILFIRKVNCTNYLCTVPNHYKAKRRSATVDKTLLYNFQKQIDYFQKYGIILLVVSPTAKWTAKSVSNSNGVTTQMAMWKRIAIFFEEIYADRF